MVARPRPLTPAQRLGDRSTAWAVWGASPLTAAQAITALVRQVKLFERLTVTAAVEGSYEAALGALLAHPLVASYPTAKAILDDYIDELTGLMPPLGIGEA